MDWEERLREERREDVGKGRVRRKEKGKEMGEEGDMGKG